LDENGEAIDSAAAPGSPPPTRGNALKIDYDGVVSYDGQTNALIKDHTWDISIFGIPVKTGGDTNDEERTTDDSNEKVSDYIPLRVSGKYYVSFNFSGTGGSCIGSLWVEIDENPVGTIPWVVGAGFLLVGVAGLAFAIPTGAAALGAATTAAAAAGAVSAAGAAPTAPPPDDAVIGGDTPPPDNGQVIGDSGGDAEGDPPGGNDDDSTVIGG
jgi:hypothetical protein